MKAHVGHYDVVVVLDENDTYSWAHRPGNRWPCSTLSGHSIVVQIDMDGLADLVVDGQRPEEHIIDMWELRALLVDSLRGVLPRNHFCAWLLKRGDT